MLFSRQVRSWLLGFLVLSCPALAGESGDLSGPVLHADVSEVRVVLFASDEHNRTVTLRRDDFAVVDNERVIRNFRSFMHTDEAGIDVVVLVDTSASVGPRLSMAVDDVLQLLRQEDSIPESNVSVIAFGGMQPGLVCAGDCRRPSVAGRLLVVRAAGTTPLYDALVMSATLAEQRKAPLLRQVIVVFSDGEDTISVHSLREALSRVIASDALVYAADLNPSSHPGRGSSLLQNMAEATGGRYFTAQAGMASVLKAALEDLRSSYVVTYPLPSREAGFHSIRVLPTHNLNLSFHSRNGYYYEAVAR